MMPRVDTTYTAQNYVPCDDQGYEHIDNRRQQSNREEQKDKSSVRPRPSSLQNESNDPSRATPYQAPTETSVSAHAMPDRPLPAGCFP